MSYPLVSVIVPAYNHEKYIVECLKSIFDQEYRRLEIILIDDGSTDSTAEKASAFLSKHAPSSVLIRQKNSGAANAINRGIALSRGDYINIINSDDYFSPDRISFFVDLCERTGAELAFSEVNFVDHMSMPAVVDGYLASIVDADRKSYDFPSIGFAFMKNQLAISTGNLFFSKRIFDLVGSFNDYRYVHDWDFILRCLYYTEPVRIRQKLYNYRFHGENSFKSLADIAGYETKEVMRNFLWRMTSSMPKNELAPCPFYWHVVFEKFIDDYNYSVYMPPRYRMNKAI